MPLWVALVDLVPERPKLKQIYAVDFDLIALPARIGLFEVRFDRRLQRACEIRLIRAQIPSFARIRRSGRKRARPPLPDRSTRRTLPRSGTATLEPQITARGREPRLKIPYSLLVLTLVSRSL